MGKRQFAIIFILSLFVSKISYSQSEIEQFLGGYVLKKVVSETNGNWQHKESKCYEIMYLHENDQDELIIHEYNWNDERTTYSKENIEWKSLIEDNDVVISNCHNKFTHMKTEFFGFFRSIGEIVDTLMIDLDEDTMKIKRNRIRHNKFFGIKKGIFSSECIYTKK